MSLDVITFPVALVPTVALTASSLATGSLLGIIVMVNVSVSVVVPSDTV